MHYWTMRRYDRSLIQRKHANAYARQTTRPGSTEPTERYQSWTIDKASRH